MIDEETNTLIAQWYLANIIHGIADARAFSDWAIFQLEQGRDTKNLRMLASMFNATVFLEVEDHFRKSLGELEWDFPSQQDCLERYSRHVASEIIGCKITPLTGCEQLFDIDESLNHPAYLSNWRGVFWSGEELDRDGHDKLIIDEAERLLAGEIPDQTELYVHVHAAQTSSQADGFFARLWQGLFG